jgi:predicted nucleic acid-binding protein
VTAYFDASALVKLVIYEPGTDDLLNLLARPVTAITSALSTTEVTRALRRTPVAREDVEAALTGFHLVEVTRPILERAAWLGAARLRALDAIHLATALSLGVPDLRFVCYDERLADAAREAGLRVAR